MPIEIKELHIRVTVETPESGSTPQKPPEASPNGGSDDSGKDALIAECVEQVIQILQNKMER